MGLTHPSPPLPRRFFSWATWIEERRQESGRCGRLLRFGRPAQLHTSAEAASFADELCRDIPARPAGAVSGSGFARSMGCLTGTVRENAVLAELGRGNVPPFLRQLKPVHLSFVDRHGRPHEAVIFVMPDYLAVGSDEDLPCRSYTMRTLRHSENAPVGKVFEPH